MPTVHKYYRGWDKKPRSLLECQHFRRAVFYWRCHHRPNKYLVLLFIFSLSIIIALTVCFEAKI